MNSNICRICLEDDAWLDWNTSVYKFHGITYKDCYYKYTQLKCNDNDTFPQMLCQNCCEALHSTHTLITMALESDKVLREKYSFNNNQLQKKLGSPINSSSEFDDNEYLGEFETVLVEETDIGPILDDNIIYDASSDGDIDVAEKVLSKFNGQIAVCDNINTKAKTEKSVTTKNIFEEPLMEPLNDAKEVNALPIKSKRKYTSNIKKKKTIYGNKSKIKVKQINETEQIGECISIEFDLIDENKVEEGLRNDNNAEEEIGIANVEPKPIDKYKEQRRMCSICSKVLRSKYAVKMHEQTHIENRVRKETCKVCGVKFYDQRSLKGHMRIHQEDRVKQHKCEFCSKAFYDKGGLQIHRRIHLGQMISCSLCPKQFYRQVELDRHMNSHSATTLSSDKKKITKYFVRCSHCDKSVLSTTFKSHTAAHLNEPLMKCSICDKEYFTKKGCVRHVMRKHQKTDKECNDFIVQYARKRISHLFLKQFADVQAKIH